MARLLHTADWHLSSEKSGNIKDSASLQISQKFFLENLWTLAKETNTDILLLAGDVFEITALSEASKAYMKAFLKAERPFWILAVAGNHDPYFEMSIWSEFSDIPKFYVFDAQCSESIYFQDLSVVVSGQSFASSHSKLPFLPNPQCSDILYKVETSDSKVNKENDLDFSQITTQPSELFYLSLVHGDLEKLSIYNPLLDDVLDTPQFLDYLALGHIHKPSGLLPYRNKELCVAYSGAPYGRNTKEMASNELVFIDTKVPSNSLSFEALEEKEIFKKSNLFSVSSKTQTRQFDFYRISYHAFNYLEIVLTLKPEEEIKPLVEKALDKLKDILIYPQHLKITLKGQVQDALSESIQFVEDELRVSLIQLLEQPQQFQDNLNFKIQDERRQVYDIDVLSKEPSLRGLFVNRYCQQKALLQGDEVSLELLDDALEMGLMLMEKEVLNANKKS